MSEFHVEIGGYALDALDEGERAAFERHLAGCEQCRRELAEFTETAARLAALSETAPPPELRSAVLGAIARVRPLPPETAADPTTPAQTAPAPTTPVQSTPVQSTPVQTTPAPTAPAPTAPPQQARPTAAQPRRAQPRRARPESPPPADEVTERRLRRRSRLLTLAVAAAMVVALALGGWTYVLHRDQQVAAANAAAATRLLSAPDVRTYPVQVAGSPATFVVSRALDQAMFVGASLPPAAAGRTYQLWTLDPDKNATPDVVFAGGPDTRVFMTGDIAGAAAVAVSDEPAGGSARPSDVLGLAGLTS
ncbi:anti-sigma factor [Microlunatus ginsengisoli]|uniref:Regulator of SigK n=1 Tax=Microlunatus ginsengisoli TaxID=363863 RepID=A0ABP6ZQF4_9ACTN